MENRTESAWVDWVSERLQVDQTEALHKLRPSHTYTYVIDADSFDILQAFPNKVEEIICRGVRKALCGHWANWKCRNITDPQLKKQQIVKDNMNGRNDTNAWNRLTVKIEFYPTVTMREISPKIEKEAIVVDGRIMAVSTKRGYLKEGTVFCPNNCEDGTATISAGPTLRSFIPKCPTCKTLMHLNASTAVTDYVQTIKLQEITAESFHKPIDFEVKVVGDDVFNTWIGKRVRVAGNFITDIIMNGKQQEHKQFIFNKYMHEIAEVENVCITKERAAEIKELIKDPENFKGLLKSFAPNIEGKLLQKEGIMYSFVMGSRSEVRRIHIHALEIGNAGKGKSELIKQIPRVIAKSKFILANNSTAAGLGIGMVKMDSGTSEPAGGPLVMLSPDGHLALDELDKMHQDDQKSLLSSMENQVVTKNVAGTDLYLDSYLSIISAANPKWGQWDDGHGIPENINFPMYLLTRFDFITCSVKSNAMQEQEIANKILGLEPITTQAMIKPLISEAELMQYINYCKTLNPKLTPGAKIMLKDFYNQMCQATTGNDKVIPMTPRELEGMIRMSTARAKLLQKDEADEDDVKVVMDLKTAALNSFPGVSVENAGQQLKIMSEVDDKEKLKLDIITECEDEDGTVDNVEVTEKWVEMGVYKNQKTADREFDKMIGESMWGRSGRYVYKH
jgi:replicative DNA helicase Mcm